RCAIRLIGHRQRDAHRQSAALQCPAPAALQRLRDRAARERRLDPGVARAGQAEGQRESLYGVLTGDRPAVDRQRSTKRLIPTGMEADGPTVDGDFLQPNPLQMLRGNVQSADQMTGVAANDVELEAQLASLCVNGPFPVTGWI